MSNLQEDLSNEYVPDLPEIDSITSRPKYQPSLYFHPKHDGRKFGSIIAPYHLTGEKIKCGIADCGSPHWHGYLITTSDGLETNIGKDCGAKHFNADFKAEMSRHDRLYEIRLKTAAVLDLKNRAPLLLWQIENLQNVYMKLKTLRQKLRGCLSRADSQRLDNKAKTGDGNIYKYEPMSDRDKEAYFAANPEEERKGQEPMNEIKVAEIHGLAFLTSTYNDELIFNCIKPLRDLTGATEEEIRGWRTGEISKTHKWINDIPRGISRMQEVIEQGDAFFKSKNLDNLELLGIDQRSLKVTIAEIKRLTK